MTSAQIDAIAGCLERLNELPSEVTEAGIWYFDEGKWRIHSWNDVAQLIAEAVDDVDGETGGEST